MTLELFYLGGARNKRRFVIHNNIGLIEFELNKGYNLFQIF